MNTLTAHLTAGTGHGRLPFHSDCPVCESQRLLGRAPALAVPLRAQAGLLTGAIAAGALVPAGSVAASPPGAGLPDTDATESPPATVEDIPPSGDETTEPPTDEAPDMREVLTSPDAGTDTDGEDVAAEDVEIEPPPTTPEPPPEPPAPLAPAPAAPELPAPELPATPPPPASQPTPDPTVQVPSVPAPDESEPVAEPEGPEAKRDRDRQRTRKERGVSHPAAGTVPFAHPHPALENESAVASTPVASSPVAERARRPAEPIRGPAYMVRPGDSLWSIASRLLRAGASNGQIAKLVNRLWELNREGIGTGDPNLLRVGTKLRLP